MRISDWSSDVCSSDLAHVAGVGVQVALALLRLSPTEGAAEAGAGRVDVVARPQRLEVHGAYGVLGVAVEEVGVRHGKCVLQHGRTLGDTLAGVRGHGNRTRVG